MAHSQNLCTKGNGRSQINLPPFRVSKGRSLEPGAQSLFLLGAQKKMLILAKWSPRVQPWSPRAFFFFTQESGALNPFGTLSIAFDEQVNTADAAAAAPTAELDAAEADEYDESSDEVVEDHPDDSTLLQGEIGSSATFLLGARTRFGRVVHFNNHLFY